MPDSRDNPARCQKCGQSENWISWSHDLDAWVCWRCYMKPEATKKEKLRRGIDCP